MKMIEVFMCIVYQNIEILVEKDSEMFHGQMLWVFFSGQNFLDWFCTSLETQRNFFLILVENTVIIASTTWGTFCVSVEL